MMPLDWTQRFAIIDHFKVTDDKKICEVFDVSLQELNAAKELRSQGFFNSDSFVDFKQYGKYFSTTQKANADTTQKAQSPTPKTKTSPAKKKKTSPKKKTSTATTPKNNNVSDKFERAYNAIPYDPTPLKEFSKKYSISEDILRRHKRFDHVPEKGQVNIGESEITKDGVTESVTCIWRSPPETDI